MSTPAPQHPFTFKIENVMLDLQFLIQKVVWKNCILRTQQTNTHGASLGIVFCIDCWSYN